MRVLRVLDRAGYDHELVANLVLPPFVFMILYRTPFDALKNWRSERRAVYLTNVAFWPPSSADWGWSSVMAPSSKFSFRS